MKAFNIILSILVLLMALASAVFSFFLFEKRSELVTGWGKMATAINTASREFDKNSGTNVAKDLTAATLAHENYGELDRLLSKFTAQSKKVMEERDALVDALFRIGNSVRLNPSEKALRDQATAGRSRDAIVRGVSDTIENRDRTNRNISDFSRNNLRAGNIDRGALERGDRNALNNMVKVVNAARERRTFYENQFRTVASQSGIAGARLNFNGDYRSAVQQVTGAVNKLRSERIKLQGELTKAQRETRNIASSLAASEKKLAAANNELAKNSRIIKGYMKALNLAGPDLPMPWLDGSREAQEKVLGKVIKVDDNYGYLAVDLGTGSRVQQPIGDKFLAVDPKIVQGMALVVVRGDIKAGKAEFVARIVLDKVGTECSTADIPLNTAKKISVGDLVYIEKTK